MMLFRNPDLHIEDVISDEHNQLVQLHKNSFSHGWNEADIKSILATKGTRCWGVKIRGRGREGLKGFLVVRALFEQAEIITIAIDPNFRNKGLGRALIDHSVRQLRSDQVDQLFLEVSPANSNAIKLYHRLKFQQISTRKSYYSNPVSSGEQKDEKDATALVMRLDLT